MAYFPQQKELQYTITKLNPRFLSRCENKTHKKEDMTCQSTYFVLGTVKRNAGV
jgi:hypothetical protein